MERAKHYITLLWYSAWPRQARGKATFSFGDRMVSMYRVEIDQSGRVEKSGDTIVAFANDISYAIRIPSKTSTAGLQAWEDKGVSSKLAKPLLWASCVYLLLEGHLGDLADKATTIIIDNEFDGHENRIKSTLVEYIKKHYGFFPFRKIRIDSVGKQSPAHKKASTVRAQKHLKPDRTVTPGEIRRLILGS